MRIIAAVFIAAATGGDVSAIHLLLGGLIALAFFELCRHVIG